MSPEIATGESFAFRLSMMRPGTFIYHSHMNDVVQLSGGLYGPLIVLPPDESFDAEHDHPMVFGWRRPAPQGLEDVELNGRHEQPSKATTVGERHRFRVINIAPAGMVSAWLMRDGEPLPIRLLAKDGADLPAHQQVEVDELPEIGVGETADFTWTPTAPGTYEIRVGFAPEFSFAQTWVVTEKPPTGNGPVGGLHRSTRAGPSGRDHALGAQPSACSLAATVWTSSRTRSRFPLQSLPISSSE